MEGFREERKDGRKKERAEGREDRCKIARMEVRYKRQMMKGRK